MYEMSWEDISAVPVPGRIDHTRFRRSEGEDITTPAVGYRVVEWERHGSHMRLGLKQFWTPVDELYEADTYDGPSPYVTDAERR